MQSTLDDEILSMMRFVSERAIMPRWRNLAEHEIEEKAKDDIVTVVDREVEEYLSEALSRLQPGVAVVGEEAVHADPAVTDHLSGPCWIIDPLDGTNNFAAGRAPFGILLARSEGGVTQSGWIYDCLTGRFCMAHCGQGAWVNGERVQAQASGAAPPIAAISLIFMDESQREEVKRHIAPHYALVDIPRCAAEQYPRLALGQNDVSIFERTLAWDHAAGVLWLNEAGGMAARPDGSPYRVDEWDRKGLIGAASPELWENLAALYQKMD